MPRGVRPLQGRDCPPGVGSMSGFEGGPLEVIRFEAGTTTADLVLELFAVTRMYGHLILWEISPVPGVPAAIEVHLQSGFDNESASTIVAGLEQVWELLKWASGSLDTNGPNLAMLQHVYTGTPEGAAISALITHRLESSL